MKTSQIKLLCFCLLPSAFCLAILGQGTAFTYQGHLNDGANPANGSYDLKLTLFDAVANGNTVAGPVTNSAVVVTNGLFTTTIDFGDGVFDGSSSWLRIGVRTNGANNFISLTPRQPLTPAPYAIFANTASHVAGPLSAAQLSGTGGGIVSFTDTADSFSGNGNGLTSLNAGQLTSGKVPLAALGNAWKINGNAGLAPTNGHFLGTVDNTPLELDVNSQRALRLEPDPTSSGAPNVIGGSSANYADAGDVIGAFVGGGGATNLSGTAFPNCISAWFGSIVGGYGNWIESYANNTAIGGGLNNTVQSAAGSSVICGGEHNTIGTNAYDSIIGSGQNNLIGSNSYFSVIGGGYGNWIQGSGNNAVIGGGQNNFIGTNSFHSVIGGGFANGINNGAPFTLIGGGAANAIQSGSVYAAIAAGEQNSIGPNAGGAFIGGGTGNSNTFGGGFIGAGYYNRADNFDAVVAGGAFNLNAGYRSDVSGGQNNIITGGSSYAMIPGGLENQAGGNCAFAAGQQAQALHDGAFVWADDSQNAPFVSTATNQFLIRAQGGVGINLNNPTGDALSIGGTARMNNNKILFRASPDPNHGVGYYGSGTSFGGISPNGPVLFGYDGGALGTERDGTEHIALQWTTTSVTVSGTFNNNSDRNAKQEFAPVSPSQVLEKVAQLPITTRRYKTDATTPHIGPMAQDFYSAFKVGTDERHIAPIDEGGVALAAIQGLNQKMEEREALLRRELERRDAENAKLQEHNQSLEKRLAALEQLILSRKPD